MYQELLKFVPLVIGLAMFLSMFVVLAYFEQRSNRRKAALRNAKAKVDPAKAWEDVPGGMRRIEVPGGWMYMDYIGGHSIALAFVPKPKENSDEGK